MSTDFHHSSFASCISKLLRNAEFRVALEDRLDEGGKSVLRKIEESAPVSEQEMDEIYDAAYEAYRENLSQVLCLGWDGNHPGGSGALYVGELEGVYLVSSSDYDDAGPFESLDEALDLEYFQIRTPNPELDASEIPLERLLEIARDVVEWEEGGEIRINEERYVVQGNDLVKAEPESVRSLSEVAMVPRSMRSTCAASIESGRLPSLRSRTQKPAATGVKPHRTRYRFGADTIEGIEERLSNVERWTRGPKQALGILHNRARAEQAQRRAPRALAGPHECLEVRLFGDPNSLMSEDEVQGRGFFASLVDGPSIDFFTLAGVNPSDELHDAVWAEHDWQSILGECEEAFCVEIGEQNDRPGYGDIFCWVCVENPAELARQLRKFIVSKA